MSYCVNCGVELDSSLEECPLCNTPVINPKEIPYEKKDTPFPKEKGQVDSVKRKDLGVLLSIVVLAAILTCGLLNIFVFKDTAWSLLVIGVCIIIWVLAIPLVIYTRLPIYVSILCDGISIALYLYLITYVTPTDRWFLFLAIPILGLTVLLVEIFTFLYRKIPTAFLTTSLYVFIEIPILCVGIEIFIRLYYQDSIKLLWSAIVLAVCAMIDITLITLLTKKRLRNAVRRRLHF